MESEQYFFASRDAIFHAFDVTPRIPGIGPASKGKRNQGTKSWGSWLRSWMS